MLRNERKWNYIKCSMPFENHKRQKREEEIKRNKEQGQQIENSN